MNGNRQAATREALREETAERRADAREQVPFDNWVRHQKDRQDRVGDLARDLLANPPVEPHSRHARPVGLAQWLRRRLVYDQFEDAFRQAAQEWRDADQ